LCLGQVYAFSDCFRGFLFRLEGEQALNLTDSLKDLLCVLVKHHQAKGGEEFYLVQLGDGWHITYAHGGPSFPVRFPDLDDLRRGGLIRIGRRIGNCHRGSPTQPGIAIATRSLAVADERGKHTVVADPAFWRSRREEFESLPHGEYRLIWSTGLPISWAGELLPSQWSWWRFPDESLRARLSAVALKCARALGHDSEDGWFDEIRKADFVKYKLTGRGLEKQPNGIVVEREYGPLADVVKHSITLCHLLETGASPRRLPESTPEKSVNRRSRQEPEPPPKYEKPSFHGIDKDRFWKDRQAEFEKYSAEYGKFSAHWDAPSRTWFFWWGSEAAGVNVPQECEDIFKALARKAATGRLPLPPTPLDGEPWRLWLDFMRLRNWGFQVTSHTPCTELEWDAGVKDGKPLNTIRRERKYTYGDEWKNVYRRTKAGKLRRLSAKEVKQKKSEELSKYYHWLENGTIGQVFASSARFCEDLAAHAFESEAKASETKAAVSERAPTDNGPRQGYRTEIRAYMKQNQLTTNAMAARHFGVGVDTLKSILSGKGKLRCSTDTLKAVLTKAGVQVPS
jgi:hypothetical protein